MPDSKTLYFSSELVNLLLQCGRGKLPFDVVDVKAQESTISPMFRKSAKIQKRLFDLSHTIPDVISVNT